MYRFLGEVNRVAFNLFGVDIYWYGIIMSLAILTAILVGCLYSKFKGYGADLPINIALVILPFGILSARLFAVLFDSSLSISDFFNFRTGGLSVIGSIIGGGLALLIYLLIKKEKNKFKYFDTLCVVLILAMAIARWGNFFNGELYGQLIPENSVFARFPFAVEVEGHYFQALFFYESSLSLLGFVVLSVIYFKVKTTGYVSSIYLLYYGTVRTILEPLRQDKWILKMFGLPISQICSILMIALGIVLLVITIRKTLKVRKVNG